MDLGDALAWSIETSAQAFTISDESNRIHGLWGHGMWGPVQGPEGVGCVWMVSDDELFTKYAKTITRAARDVIFPKLDAIYPMYGNLVASFNLVHCRWLLRGGFHRAGGAVFQGNQAFSLYLRTA